MGASHRGAAGIAAIELDGRWTPEQAAEYAARRDFRLAQLLASDPRARATARWLGLCSKRFQGYGRHHRVPSNHAERARVRDGEGCGVRRPAYG